MRGRTFGNKAAFSRWALLLAIAYIVIIFLPLLVPHVGPIDTPFSRTAKAAPAAPDWALTDTDGKNWTLHQWQGKKVVFIDLMAVSWDSSANTTESMKALYTNYKDRTFFISVDIQKASETAQNLVRFKQDKAVPWAMAMDNDSLSTKYSAIGADKVVIVDGKGGLAYQTTGVTDKATLENQLSTIIEKTLRPRAPDFNVTDTDGKNWTLRQWQDKKVVLIDLMAITCESCKVVTQNIKDIYSDYKDRVFVISIDVWNTIDSVSDLKKFKSDEAIPWPMALDTDKVITKYNGDQIAKVVIVDSYGYVVYMNTGVMDKPVLKDKLDKAIAGSLKPITVNPVSLWAMAITAGFASFFSPCAFPMFPGYMAFYFKKNLEQKEKKLNVGKAAASGTVSALGIIMVYLIIGGLILLVGQAIIPFFSKLQLIIGIILLFLGALMMTSIQYDRIVAPFRKAFGGIGKGKVNPDGTKKDLGFYSGLFLYGAGYGGAASACTLPVFLAVIIGGFATGSVLFGLFLLLLYTLIAAILMVIVTVAIAVVGHQAVQKLAKYTNAIKKISGLVLLIAGVYLVLFWLAANGYVNIPGLS
jgi:cytochrome c-type biogenesis protein